MIPAPAGRSIPRIGAGAAVQGWQSSGKESSMSKKGLGSGLSHLLGEMNGPETDGLTQLPIEQLQPGKFQPRQHFDEQALDELADPCQFRPASTACRASLKRRDV